MREKVLHVISDLGVGGAQVVSHNLWPALCRSEKYEFEMCVIRELGSFGERLVDEGATIHRLHSSRKYDLKAVLQLRRLIQRGGYKIVHVHLFPQLYTVALATIGMRDVRLVFTEHGAANRRRKLGIIGKLLDKLAYARYSRIVSVNSSTRNNLLKWQPQLTSRAVVIPNAIRATDDCSTECSRAELLAELGFSESSRTNLILFAGRLLKLKGVDVLLSALSQIKDADFLLLIAGDGGERQSLERLTAALGLKDRVRFLGFRSDVPKLLKQVDFMVLPSRREGLPIIVLEAMAVGCPIIATAIDGTAEILRNEHSGLLISPDDAEQLMKTIQRFISDPALGKALAVNAMADVQPYIADNISRQLLALYDQVSYNEQTTNEASFHKQANSTVR